jgi:hypothetical protein
MAGAWELHLQCAWRLTRRSVLIVGNSDVFNLVEEGQSLRWDEEGGNQSDLRCAEFFASPELFVTSIDLRDWGGLSVHISNEGVLDVWPNMWNHEQWRLFVPGTTEHHLVVRTVDGAVEAGWM